MPLLRQGVTCLHPWAGATVDPRPALLAAKEVFQHDRFCPRFARERTKAGAVYNRIGNQWSLLGGSRESKRM